MNGGYALTDPAHDGNGHAVAKCFVAGAVCSGLAVKFNGCVMVGESLKALAFQRSETAYCHCPLALHDASFKATIAAKWMRYVTRNVGVLGTVEGDCRLPPVSARRGIRSGCQCACLVSLRDNQLAFLRLMVGIWTGGERCANKIVVFIACRA